uniref:Uncharacterized protein n=1 Tax=Mycena chlorophos TaxID=658473 RepID=A0ABQ0LY39_MYCCL|nr:predicted protein [Mycena chlorophos]
MFGMFNLARSEAFSTQTLSNEIHHKHKHKHKRTTSDGKGAVQYALQSLFSGGLERPHPLVSACKYPLASTPDPELSVSGLGNIGLPLKESDALGLISSAKPEVARDSNKTMIPGSWEVPADKMYFLNPAWDEWIRDVAGPAALTEIGVSDKDNLRVKYVFRGLFIRETTLVNTTKPVQIRPTKLGELILVPPSTPGFTGGQFSYSFRDETFAVPISDQTDEHISVVCAYAGLQQTLGPVSAGFRLSLTYDIVHDGPGQHLYVAPTLESPKQRLHRILAPWPYTQDSPACTGSKYAYPHLMGFLLTNEYPIDTATDFESSLLDGTTDEVPFKALCSVGGLALYFARIELVVQREAEVDVDDRFSDPEIQTVVEGVDGWTRWIRRG